MYEQRRCLMRTTPIVTKIIIFIHKITTYTQTRDTKIKWRHAIMKDDQYNNDSEYTSNQDDFTSTSHVNEQNTDSKQEVESIDHYDTEFTADAPAINPHESSRSEVRKYDKRTNMKVRAQHGWGWLALSVAVISFFIWTIFFAIIGGVLGVYAIRKNSLILGNAAIILSMFAVIFRLMVNPII